VKKKLRRTPRNYDGTKVTTHQLSDVLPQVLVNVNNAYHERPDLILAAWPEIIGTKLAPMTQAVSFYEGKLFVKVKNSTLFSLLNQHDKPKLLFKLKQHFPKHNIRNIVFKMG
jgi:Dna[CI] antecedent, DciA